jgi:ketosteroid isomerase-like protein
MLMKHKIIATLIFTLITHIMVLAQVSNKDVASAVEKLRTLMVQPDKKALDELVSASLSYGHSSGKVEDKASFIEALVSGTSDFTDITLSDQTINVVDQTAIVRHTLSANTNDAGKGPASVKISVLTVWIKEKGKWKLLARQAVKMQ